MGTSAGARTSRTTILIALLVSFSLAGCASQRQQIRLSEDERLNGFLEDLRAAVENHAWQDLLDAAAEDHHHAQVIEMGMSEPQYVAELLGLHMVENDIGGGEPIEWNHLDRIETLHFDDLESTTPGEWVARGSVVLDDGRRLDVEAIIVQLDGRYRMSGGVG